MVEGQLRILHLVHSVLLYESLVCAPVEALLLDQVFRSTWHLGKGCFRLFEQIMIHLHKLWVFTRVDSIEILAHRKLILISFFLVVASYHLSILFVNTAILAVLSLIKHFGFFSFYFLFSFLA